MLTTWECSGCHARMGEGKRVEYGLPLASRPAGLAPGGVERFLLQLLMLSAERTARHRGSRRFLCPYVPPVPWVPGETERLQRFLTKPEDAIAAGFNPHGVIPRINGSPFYGTRVPDLHLLRYNKYIDATGTHRLRGPEDIARYAAIIERRQSDGLRDASLSGGHAAPGGVSLCRRGPLRDWRVSPLARAAEESQSPASGPRSARAGGLPA